MNEQIRSRIYERIKFYGAIHHEADVSKIANLAYEEMIVSFLECVYKFDGMDFLFEKTRLENDEKLKSKLAMFLLPFDEARSKTIIQSLMNAIDETTRDSARNVISEKYSTLSELKENYKGFLEKVRLKHKIGIT